jgi:hypothetical protein
MTSDYAMKEYGEMYGCVDGQDYRLEWLMRVHALWDERNAWDELLCGRCAFRFLDDHHEEILCYSRLSRTRSSTCSTKMLYSGSVLNIIYIQGVILPV